MPDQASVPLSKSSILENRYRIDGLLGQGGMSRVYIAENLRFGMRVAIEENLQSTTEAHAQFEREGRLLRSLYMCQTMTTDTQGFGG